MVPSGSHATTESQARRSDALTSALGPIGAYLTDDRVVEILLNADGRLWVETLGDGMLRTDIRMHVAEAERMLRLIAAEAGVELTASTPSLSAKLPPPWGARLQASIPPIVDAPTFALRKPARVVFSLGDYAERGILSARHRGALLEAIRTHQNILIGGGTGSGKTTFANALLQVVAEQTDDRVLIIEDTPELQCAAPNKLQILVQHKVFSWRDAVQAAMRYRPDRILVGEVRDGSALELLKAWNTGHPGGMATIHANDCAGMLDRLCQLIEEVVFPAPRSLVAQTIHVCVHLRRDSAHPAGRSISGIDRVVGPAIAGGGSSKPIVCPGNPSAKGVWKRVPAASPGLTSLVLALRPYALPAAVLIPARLQGHVVDEPMPLVELGAQVLCELPIRTLRRTPSCPLGRVGGGRRVRREPQPHVPSERLGQQLEIPTVVRQLPIDPIEPPQDERGVVGALQVLAQRVLDYRAFRNAACRRVLAEPSAHVEREPCAKSNTLYVAHCHRFSFVPAVRPLHAKPELPLEAPIESQSESPVGIARDLHRLA
jgi:type IV secretion system protein VirB11